MANEPQSALVIGGSGLVGGHMLRTLRKLHPTLPISIAARDLDKARKLAEQLGHSEVVPVDLTRSDLGIDTTRRFRAVVTLLKDETLNTLRYARSTGASYLGFSDFSFDLPASTLVALQPPHDIAVLNLSQMLGGTVVLTALHHAAALRRVDSIALGAILDEEDVGGPEAQGDQQRVQRAVPLALIRKQGRFVFASGDDATRTFEDAAGQRWQGQTYPLLDAMNLAAARDVPSVRTDLAIRDRAQRLVDGPSVEVIIDIAGEHHDGTAAQLRVTLRDDAVLARVSGYGAALGVERLLGLTGAGVPPAGLYFAETLLDPAQSVEKLRALGVKISA